MIAEFHPSVLGGTVRAVPSKSASHRALICAALAKGRSRIENLIFSQDILATIDCLTALGARFECGADHAVVDGIGGKELCGAALLPCRESGSTLRFLIPVAAALGVRATFTGTGRLPSRPVTLYYECLPPKGVSLAPSSGMPLTVSGRLSGGVFSVPGDVSSQFITGLLFALPMLTEDSTVVITGAFESRPYVDMTLQMLARFGIEAKLDGKSVFIPGGQTYRPCSVSVEGDFSQAAFFLTAGAISAPVTVRGLDCRGSLQGDRRILDYLAKAGAEISVSNDAVTVSPPKNGLQAFSVDAADIPDLVPILAVLAAKCRGQTTIRHAERLRIKESDRLQTTAALLEAFGVPVKETEDGLVITGAPSLAACTISSFHDHRIAMSAAIAALSANGATVLSDAEAVRKSYPGFYDDYQMLGGIVHVLDLEQDPDAFRLR